MSVLTEPTAVDERDFSSLTDFVDPDASLPLSDIVNPDRFPPRSETNARLRAFVQTEDDPKKILKRLRQMTPDNTNRATSVQVLLSWLGGMGFDEAATEIFRTSPKKLTRWIQFVETVPKAKADEVATIVQVVRRLHQVLDPESTADWFHTPIPALGDRTPVDLIQRRKLPALLELAKSYVDPGFA